MRGIGSSSSMSVSTSKVLSSSQRFMSTSPSEMGSGEEEVEGVG